MEVKAKISYLRIAPRKVRLVADMIRGKDVEKAQNILNFTTRKVSLPLIKLLKQALANAKNNFQLDTTNLYIYKIFVDEGPKYKRWQPRARGQAYEIQKKTSHITIILEELKKTAKKAKKVVKKPSLAKVTEGEEEKKVEEFKKEKKIEKPKMRPIIDTRKSGAEKGIRKMFRRKAIS